MKLCLLFHCLCESYDSVPDRGRELYVSVSDMGIMVEGLLERGYKFSTLEDPAPNTVTMTFDDGYYNNYLFRELSRSYNVPYIIFLPAYYVMNGDRFPWFIDNGIDYAQVHNYDYYANYSELLVTREVESASGIERPMNFEELRELASDDQVEYGCHGYYHQPLSKKYEKYLCKERDLALSALKENLGIEPRYFALANGIYTRWVVKELLRTFDKVLTIEGRPLHPGDAVIHRLSLINPNIGGPLIQQIDRNLGTLRQIKRTVRTFRRLRL